MTSRHDAPVRSRDTRVWVSAQVVINAAMKPGRVGADQQFVLQHELGHVVGLAHVHDEPGEVMNDTATTMNTGGAWGSGDRAGLARVGSRTGPCTPPVSPA